ncbi:MAG: PIN domain-containing protein [Cellvibrionaceae bacterium]|nr:PIN domain-containing protein [Cellvibrionaceae bacterium]
MSVLIRFTAAGLTHSGIASLITPVKTHFLWRPMLRNPNDEMVLEVAVNGQADAIVTFNLKDYGNIAKSKFNIDVITPYWKQKSFFLQRMENADLEAFKAILFRSGRESPRTGGEII